MFQTINTTYFGVLVGMTLNSVNPYVNVTNLSYTKSENLNSSANTSSIIFNTTEYPVYSAILTKQSFSLAYTVLTPVLKTFDNLTFAITDTTVLPYNVSIPAPCSLVASEFNYTV